MSGRFHGFASRAFWAVALVLLLATGNARAAAGTAESRLYQSASKELQDGFWGLAEKDFNDFLKKYPDSELYSDVVVKKAQAQFKQGKFDELLGWLDSQQVRAGKSADEFAYWKAEANYYKGNYAAAADGFDHLAADFPDSARRLDALIEGADARGRLEDWPRVVDLLGRPDGLFQQIARTNPGDTNLVRGFFLLSQAQSARKDYAAAEETLALFANQHLRPEWEWGRLYLLCDLSLAQGQPGQALQTSSNLLRAAGSRSDLLAESMAARGEILERLDRLPEAIKSYETNLASEQLEIRRKALLRIVDLDLRQNDPEAAATSLRNYLAAHPTEKGSDLEWLTLGELTLRQYFQARMDPKQPKAGTNLFEARTDFEKVVNTTNSPLVGKAFLNLGWCLWADGKLGDSAAAFSGAIPLLPAFSEDRAVARFKLADVLYEQKDFPGAIASYKSVLNNFDTNAEMQIAARFNAANILYPPKEGYAPATGQAKFTGSPYETQAGIKNGLFERALYQIVRASLETTNIMEATNALNQILAWYPDRLLGQPSMLLVGQALNAVQGPAAARGVYADFATRFPQSALLPEVKLAIARTYETERDWPGAIAQYDDWVTVYATNPALPRAEFSRAWANVPAGRETNAFNLFTNFVARFQTNAVAVSNELVPAAMIWIGDYYMNREEFRSAEENYQVVSRNWPNSELAFQATMKAGKAAEGRGNYSEAIKLYFSTLTGNSNCPLAIRLEAQFAEADAKLQISGATNLQPCKDALVIFSGIADAYPTNKLAPLARGRLGDCYRLLAADDPAFFQSATNAYEGVITNDLADIATRSLAAYGVAMTLEDMARLKPPAEQRPLLQMAVDHFLDIAYYEKNLRDNEQPDPAWIERAGLEAGKLLESLGEWNLAVNLYQKLARDLPALRPMLESRTARIPREKNTAAKD